MSRISILHISDLHYQYNDEEQQDFIKVFLNDIDRNAFKNSCKFVVFSGDLVLSPNEDNFLGVEKNFIKPLMSILELKMDKFFVVPGNHEIDRENIEVSLEQLAVENYFRSYKKTDNEKRDEHNKISKHLHHKFDNYLDFYKRLFCEKSADVEHFIYEFNSAHIYHYSNNSIGIACINSSLSCFGNSTTEVGKIYIGREQIDNLYKNIKDCDIKIAVFHHPLESSDIISHDEVKKTLYDKFHVILTGHNHTERAYSVTENDRSAYYSVSSCLYSVEYKTETIYDPSYSFVQIDCDELSGIAFYRKYYAFRGVFDIDLRYFKNGYHQFNLNKPNNTFRHIEEKAIIDLKKPILISNEKDLVFNLEEEKDGYNVDYRGQFFSNQNLSNADFSMYSLRDSRFKGCSFNTCLFTNTILVNSVFEDCSFNNVRFINIDHFYTVEYCDKNKLVAAAGEGGVIVVFNIVNESNDRFSFSRKLFLYEIKGKVLSLSWRCCGKYIAASDSTGCIYIWDIHKAEPVYKKQIGNNPVYAVKWSPNGEFITSSDESGYKLYVYRFQEQDSICKLKNITTLYSSSNMARHYQQILFCAWSPDSKWLATVGIDRNICIWNNEGFSGTERNAELKCSKSNIHNGYIRKLIWNKESNGFITCSDDGTVKQWSFDCDSNVIELKNEICIKPREGNNEVLSLVWFSKNCVISGLRDDDYAIIGNFDKEPEILKIEKAHKGRIWDMCCVQDEKIIFSVGNGKLTAWFFDTKMNVLIPLCSYESKLLCSGMQLTRCDGLQSGCYRVLKNKDIPEVWEMGNLMDFLLTKGATTYPPNN